jgi:hypothetical protein
MLCDLEPGKRNLGFLARANHGARHTSAMTCHSGARKFYVAALGMALLERQADGLCKQLSPHDGLSLRGYDNNRYQTHRVP